MSCTGLKFCIDRGDITAEEAQALGYNAKLALNSPAVKQLIEADILTVQQATQLADGALKALENPEILAQVLSRHLSLYLVTTPLVQVYVDRGDITAEQAQELPYDAKLALNSPTVKRFIEADILTVQQATQLTAGELKVLENPNIRQALLKGAIVDEFGKNCPEILRDIQQRVTARHTLITNARILSKRHGMFRFLPPELCEFISIESRPDCTSEDAASRIVRHCGAYTSYT